MDKDIALVDQREPNTRYHPMRWVREAKGRERKLRHQRQETYSSIIPWGTTRQTRAYIES